MICLNLLDKKKIKFFNLDFKIFIIIKDLNIQSRLFPSPHKTLSFYVFLFKTKILTFRVLLSVKNNHNPLNKISIFTIKNIQ
jgi:hypothetical protein